MPGFAEMQELASHTDIALAVDEIDCLIDREHNNRITRKGYLMRAM